MNLQQIKAAVMAGHKVYWMNPAYEVICDKVGQWLIVYNKNQSTIGLTYRDDVTLNGLESDFYCNLPHPIDQYAFFKTLSYKSSEPYIAAARTNYDALTANMSDEQKVLLEKYVTFRIEEYAVNEAFNNSSEN